MKKLNTKQKKALVIVTGAFFVGLVGFASWQVFGSPTEVTSPTTTESTSESSSGYKHYLDDRPYQEDKSKAVIDRSTDTHTTVIPDSRTSQSSVIPQTPTREADLSSERRQALTQVQQLVVTQQTANQVTPTPTPAPIEPTQPVTPEPEKPIEKPTDPVDPPVVVVVDYSNLMTLIAYVESLDFTNYLSSTTSAVTYEVGYAKSMVTAQSSTQSQVNTQETRLRNAISQLVLKGDSATLLEVMTEAKALDTAFYNSPSIDTLLDVLVQAEALLKDEQSQATLDDMQAQLQAALDNVEKKSDLEIAVIQLQRVIVQAEGLSADDYTGTSFAAVTTALAQGQATIEETAATLEDVTTAKDALEQAIASLVKQADKEELLIEITAAEGLDLSRYTPTTAQEVTTALTAARVLVDDTEVSQDTVNASVVALKGAVSQLVLKADTSALATLLAEIDTLQESDYTANSWQALQAALQGATDLIANETATQAEVDAKVSSIQTAKGQLEAAPAPSIQAEIQVLTVETEATITSETEQPKEDKGLSVTDTTDVETGEL
ncbi:hypothetical protein [Enterococcus sp. LJL90]